jgi:serine/threonine-protein kinase HipA
MSEPAAYVSVDLDGQPRPVGRLWVHADRGRERASFEYEPAWLASRERFALQPALALTAGAFQTRAGEALFGALGDSAPDRWGRTLIARAERLRAKSEKRAVRTLRELDYLLAASDETRAGALRFSASPDGPFLADVATGAVPPLVDLPKLLNAADHVLDESESAQDLRLLLAPGSSLGGARPKASVRGKDGSLLIAKFPARSDAHDVVAWEAIALTLAKKSGITVANTEIAKAASRRVLLVRRFDREGTVRIPFLSAMSALDANDVEPRSYVEIADILRTFGSATRKDLSELWRRIVFSVLISNTDDHLRNHGFLYAGDAGWRLAPAYDLNPVPVHVKPRVLSTSIDADGDPTASIELARGVARHFGVSVRDAESIIREVGAAVRGWRTVASAMKLSKREIDTVASAFEHDDSARFAPRP